MKRSKDQKLLENERKRSYKGAKRPKARGSHVILVLWIAQKTKNQGDGRKLGLIEPSKDQIPLFYRKNRSYEAPKRPKVAREREKEVL
ncbi:hypothetical protein [Bacillus piscicola]|uniref:hypothetical protein n=1 Tax=Bacillus piscicola TaxID=1632684 RepID=UPI001F096C71|nr:hypothetical protein [Bacillus piscicola]